MTIEALLTSIDNRLAVLATLLGNEGGEVAGAATPATAPTGRRRGRPAADDPKPATTVTPVATAPVSQPDAPAVDVDPFDAPPPVAAPVVKADKAAARASLEKFRQRLKAHNIQTNGDSDADAENKATARALAWLKEVTGYPTLAGIPEDKFQVIVDKEPTAK
jgi:hypothetical protein